MRLFDLHCDTLYKAVTKNLPIDDKSMETSVVPTYPFTNVLQAYAVWVPDTLNGDEAERLFFKAADRLKSECGRLNIALAGENDNLKSLMLKNAYTACLTVENAVALNGKLENISKFAQLGVKMITLTWNAGNLLGGGVEASIPVGLTEFGKAAVREMENNGIAIDISHASDKLFFDVMEETTKPVAASHSNSRAITGHKRNLTDEQFKLISKRGGIVGLNLHRDFLSETPEAACVFDIFRHCEHFLSLGGENSICIGSDFDGGCLPYDISGSRSLYKFYDILLKHNYNESIIKKIFYENALNFFENFDNGRNM